MRLRGRADQVVEPGFYQLQGDLQPTAQQHPIPGPSSLPPPCATDWISKDAISTPPPRGGRRLVGFYKRTQPRTLPSPDSPEYHSASLRSTGSVQSLPPALDILQCSGRLGPWWRRLTTGSRIYKHQCAIYLGILTELPTIVFIRLCNH